MLLGFPLGNKERDDVARTAVLSSTVCKNDAVVIAAALT